MLVLLLLGASVCGGLSYNKEQYYGSTLSMSMQLNTYFIEFKAEHDSDVRVLWNRDLSAAPYNRRGEVRGSYYVIENVTQRDSGVFTMRDKDKKVLFTKVVKVTENKRFFKLNDGEKFSYTFALEPYSCNIYFFSKSDNKQRGTKTEMVREGRLQESWNHFDCEGFEVLKPCGLLNEGVPMSCNGLFEFRDQNDNKALVIELEIERIRNDAIYFYIGVGVFIAALLCCCCVRCCCCRKKSSQKNRSATAAGSAVNFHENDGEHARPGRRQLSQPSTSLYPTGPSLTQNNPLIHYPQTVNMPTAHTEIAAPAERKDAPTVPLCSDNEPRFELKGVPSVQPLSSASTHCDVYTSDKLNFL